MKGWEEKVINASRPPVPDGGGNKTSHCSLGQLALNDDCLGNVRISHLMPEIVPKGQILAKAEYKLRIRETNDTA